MVKAVSKTLVTSSLGTDRLNAHTSCCNHMRSMVIESCDSKFSERGVSINGRRLESHTPAQLFIEAGTLVAQARLVPIRVQRQRERFRDHSASVSYARACWFSSSGLHSQYSACRAGSRRDACRLDLPRPWSRAASPARPRCSSRRTAVSSSASNAASCA